MKEQVLKLCKRLKNCTLNDITQLMDIEPSVLEVILLFLINENKITEQKRHGTRRCFQENRVPLQRVRLRIP